MENKTQILQIGLEDWTPYLTEEQKQKLDWIYLDLKSITLDKVKDVISAKKRGTFNGVLCTDEINNWSLEILELKIEAYSLIIDERFETLLSPDIIRKKIPWFMDVTDKSKIIEILKNSFFGGQGGSTIHPNTINVQSQFHGKKVIKGDSFVLEGNYQKYKDTALLSWQYNIGFINQQSRKIYLQIEHGKGVKISLAIDILNAGGEILERRYFSENEIIEGIDIQYVDGFRFMSFSLMAEGEGVIDIGILHIQDSRNGFGEYLLGGKKITDSHNQNLYYYFNPGDLKPPMTVYFAGYHTGKSFEAFYAIKKPGTPFLLITDSRLEGGSFYMGSPELENKLIGVIKSYLDYLSFSHQDLILTGLSMGTFGALYYAAALSPHAVLAGKPLVNIGDIVQNGRLIRPDAFETALDIQYSLMGGISKKKSEQLNKRFWDVFDQGNFERTVFIIAYMLNDDYDDQAYYNLRDHLIHKGSHLIGKGIVGRHNDNTTAINQWFFGHLERILREDFGREPQNVL